MPAYATSGSNSLTPNPVLPAVMYPGDDVYVFGTCTQNPGQLSTPNDSNVLFETVAAGERSIAVCLAPRPSGYPPGLMVQVSTNADPGSSAEIDVQDATVDADGAYLTSATTTYSIKVWTKNGAIWTAWAQLQPESGRFVSLKCITNPNGVKFTAKLSYV